MLSYTVFIITWPAGHWYTSVVQLVGSCLSNCPGFKPITRTYRQQWPSKATREKLPFVQQLLFRAIALAAAADLILAKTLQNIVDRVFATTSMAAIVAKR